MVKNKIKLMEVCGTHTMAIARSGIKKLLPKEIELISGPGCPVCVTPQHDIDKAIEAAKMRDVIMVTFGDMIRVPGSKGSLQEAKASGADIRVVYSCLDSLTIAEKNPKKRVVFMGVGFETTSPTIAATIKEAKKRKIENFFVFSNFKRLFPALDAIASSKKIKVDGFICPGHVSVITGTIPYESVAKKYKKSCVITGFEDDDILKGIRRLVEKIKSGSYDVEVAYKRAVKRTGNQRARAVLDSVFKPADSDWRGLGQIKKSGLSFKQEYKGFDADREFDIKIKRVMPKKGCLCGEVLQGMHSPRDCKLFKKICTPERPIGPCMVSSEGTCAAYYKYGG